MHILEEFHRCQFGSQGLSLYTSFLGSYPYEKPSSKIQSSHVYLSTPWDLTGLGAHLPQPMSPYRSAWYSVWEAVTNDWHHSVRLSGHIQSGRDLAGTWVSSDTWLLSLICLWISTCTSNVTEHTPHEVTNVHSYQCCKGRSFLVSPDSFPWCSLHIGCALGIGWSLLSHNNPSSI